MEYAPTHEKKNQGVAGCGRMSQRLVRLEGALSFLREVCARHGPVFPRGFCDTMRVVREVQRLCCKTFEPSIVTILNSLFRDFAEGRRKIRLTY